MPLTSPAPLSPASLLALPPETRQAIGRAITAAVVEAIEALAAEGRQTMREQE